MKVAGVVEETLEGKKQILRLRVFLSLFRTGMHHTHHLTLLARTYSPRFAALRLRTHITLHIT